MRKRSRFKKIREFVNQFQTCVYLRKKKEDVFRILFLHDSFQFMCFALVLIRMM